VLAAEGLVTMKVRRGAYVTEVSEKDLRDAVPLAQPFRERRGRCGGANRLPC
jgi:DNA-binding FadR family transcriptional regulator